MLVKTLQDENNLKTMDDVMAFCIKRGATEIIFEKRDGEWRIDVNYCPNPNATHQKYYDVDLRPRCAKNQNNG
jgi:hypothetical protein